MARCTTVYGAFAYITSSKTWTTSSPPVPKIAAPRICFVSASKQTASTRAFRVASMSETIKYVLWAEPGAADVRVLPNWMEHDEPGGVNWNTPEPGGVTSCLHPRLR